MNDLPDRVSASHGDLERWNKITLLECDVSVPGSTWSRKGWPDALKNVHVSAHAQDQWISYRPFTGENKRSRCTPAHTIIETLDGQIVNERHDPRSPSQVIRWELNGTISISLISPAMLCGTI